MRLPRLVRDAKPWQLALAAGAAWTFAVVLLSPLPKDVAPPPPVPRDDRKMWFPIEGAPRLQPGGWYRACVELPWYVPSALVTEEKVIAYARKLGFTSVRAWLSLPPGWQPSACDGDVYVEAAWSSEPKTLNRPDALVGAWELLDIA